MMLEERIFNLNQIKATSVSPLPGRSFPCVGPPPDVPPSKSRLILPTLVTGASSGDNGKYIVTAG